MKNKEINDEIASLMPTLNESLNPSARLGSVEILLQTFGQLIALKAYEKAARAVCCYCQIGLTAEYLDSPQRADSWSSESRLIDGWVHPKPSDMNDGRVFRLPCAAAEIRALKESLTAEPVSSRD